MHTALHSDSILVRRGFRRPGKLRVAMRRAQGVKPSDIARECRLDQKEIEDWLAEDDIEELAQCCRATMHLPVEDRLREMERTALDLLEIALEERDVRVALFVADLFSRGKNPARVLAETVNRKVTQAGIPLDRPLSRPKPPPADPVAATKSKAFANMMRPWAGAISEARRHLSDEIVRALPSAIECETVEVAEDTSLAEPEASAQSKPKAKRPMNIFEACQKQPFVFADLFPNTRTSITTPRRKNPRDGP